MISIILPCYNGDKWLAEAIESAINQKYSDNKDKTYPYGGYELIIIDDGSTDNSLEIAKHYENEFQKGNIKNWLLTGIKVVSQVNKGLASARNTGIMNSKGFYILPLDADDILLPNCVEEIYTTGKTDADIIGLSFQTFGTSNQPIILMPNPTLEDFKTGNRLGYCSAIKKSALLEVGGYSPKMVEGYEDLHLWINLLSRGKKIIAIPEIVWKYRTKEKSMWKDALNHHQKLINQINKDFPQCQLTF